MNIRRAVVTLSIVSLVFAQEVLADTAVFGTAKDSTLYSEDASVSNGSGPHFYVGQTNSTNNRRGVIAFDFACTIPAGATINSASLTLHVSRSPFTNSNAQPVALCPLTADWGEGASDAGAPGGSGVSAEDNDATWSHRFWPVVTWATAGGDYLSASASVMVPHTNNGFATWPSNAALVADVQGWLNNSTTNFGWILVGDESAIGTARRFDTRENFTSGFRPALTVMFTPSASGAGAVPNGDDVPGAPLTLSKGGGGSITLSWGASCLGSDTNYEVYEGLLGNFTSHGPVTCATGGTSSSFVPMAASAYYLAVPRNASFEGSHGKDSSGCPRPRGATSCLPQALSACF